MHHRLRVVEALVLLTVAALLVRVVPFRIWSGLLGRSAAVPGAAPVSQPPPPAMDRAAAVALALRSAQRRLPWTSTCLMLSLAGRLMLGRRGIASLVRIGVTGDSSRHRAHAWLLADGLAVTGGVEALGYVPISEFRAGGQRDGLTPPSAGTSS